MQSKYPNIILLLAIATLPCATFAQAIVPPPVTATAIPSCADETFCKPPLDCEQQQLSAEDCEAAKHQPAAGRIRGRMFDNAEINEGGFKFGDTLPGNSEQLLPDAAFTLRITDPDRYQPRAEDPVQVKQASDQVSPSLQPLDPIQYQENDPIQKYATIKSLLETLKKYKQVRLQVNGYAENAPLSSAERAQYGDQQQRATAKARVVAEYLRTALQLPEEKITYAGKVVEITLAQTNNENTAGRGDRVEIEIWYEGNEKLPPAQTTTPSDTEVRQTGVCRTQKRCIYRRKSGGLPKIQLKYALPPIPHAGTQIQVADSFIVQLRSLLQNYNDRQGLLLKFVGHTDNQPLSETLASRYQNKVALGLAVAQQAAQQIQQKLGLPVRETDIGSRGDSQPYATNETASGRALNRRVEIEIWFDDPNAEKWQQPQNCPGDAGADTVKAVHDEKILVLFKDGQPEYPQNYMLRIRKILEQLDSKANLRINFIGHTSNERLSRRAAMVYGSHVKLSESRAERVRIYTQQQLGLSDQAVQSEGRGFLEPYTDNKPSPFASKNFLTPERDSDTLGNDHDARVELEFVYAEAAVVQQDPDVEVTPVVQDEPPVSPFALQPIRITVDGKAIDQSRMHSADIQRCTDVELSKADIRFQYDNLKRLPKLNVHASPSTIAYQDDPASAYQENVTIFTGYTNYSAFITRAEVRVFDLEQSLQSEPLAVIQLDRDYRAEWWWIPKIQEHKGPVRELRYVMRVYDKQGHFDQTYSKRLWVVNKRELTEDALNPDQQAEQRAGYGENALALRNINITGGTVTISGKSIPAGHHVWLANQSIPVGEEGAFVAEDIIPDGLNSVEVAVLDTEGNGELYMRDFRFKQHDWFYVGMADLTVGIDDTHGPAKLLTQDETHYNNDTFIDGRFAFYTKGKTASDIVITASADTLEEPFENLFSNFMNKNPDAVFRRLDPDYFYPTYGDDSTVTDDAPTKGKFYLKAEKNKSFALWGNFETKQYETDLAQIDRSLYGADFHLESENTTRYGESRQQLDLFGAEPGTIQQREEFRGTGGSLYFLNRRDITTGSDRVRIEVRDKDSGIVLQIRNLVPNQDYDIDAIQGRIILTQPLPSTADDGLLVSNGSQAGHPVFLVVRYEYTPGFEELQDMTIGARASKWFGDHLRLGTTYSSQEQIGDTHELTAVDLTLRATPASYIRIESARSTGPGQNEIFSNDGGFQFNPLTAPPLNPDTTAAAQRIEMAGRLSDIITQAPGSLTLYNEQREAGFAAPGQYAGRDITLQGGSFTTPVGSKTDIYLKFDSREQTQGLETAAAELDTRYRYHEHWQFSGGVRQDRREDHSLLVPLTQTQGDRTDLAIEARYDSRSMWSLYGFAQNTLDTKGNRETNDRVGTGGSYQINDRLKLDGEFSSGDGGSGARIGTDYLATDRTNIYFAYLLNPERDDTGLRARNGRSVAGFRSRYSDSVSVYGEERYTFGDVPIGLTHAYGVDLAASDSWLLGFNMETGTLEDSQTTRKTERNAYGVQASYGSTSIQYATIIEFRRDITDTSERETTLFKNNISFKLNSNWRIVGKLNVAESQSTQGEFYDGNFKEIVLGYAYRPVQNDRLNAIMKYTYFENLPSPNQVGPNNATAELNQKSNIYAADITWDWNARLTLGSKYAVRIGEVATDRVNPKFFESNASLMVLRGDWHIVKHWDVLTELRHLSVKTAQDSRSGLLLCVYRHMGDNIKLGIGYNFTDFSDDLTHLDYDSQGLFINIIGKM